jgi:hypothetical protein
MGLLAAALGVLTPTLWGQAEERIEFFEMRIRPLLADNCFACHTSARRPIGACCCGP